MQIGRRPEHTNRPNERTDPYVSWHCRKTVTGASQAAGHSSARSQISSEGRRRPPLRTGFKLRIRWKSTRAWRLRTFGTRDITGPAVTRQENQRRLAWMIWWSRDGRGRSATSARVAARLAAALREDPCVVSGREERGRGNPARVRSARPGRGRRGPD